MAEAADEEVGAVRDAAEEDKPNDAKETENAILDQSSSSTTSKKKGKKKKKGRKTTETGKLREKLSYARMRRRFDHN